MAGRVLITGATGFVGSHITEAFLKAGYEVRCGARDPKRPRWLAGLPVEILPLNLDRPEHLSPALEDVETVVHAAGITSARRPEDYDRVNAVGTRRLADAAREKGVRRLVQISSLAARGPDNAAHPTSDYGWSKRKAERNLYALSDDLEAVVLRPAAVYGPRDTDLLPLFRLAKKGLIFVPPGPGLLQPVYATDVAAAALAAANSPHLGAGPFPVAKAGRYSWDAGHPCLGEGYKTQSACGSGLREDFSIWWTHLGEGGETGGRGPGFRREEGPGPGRLQLDLRSLGGRKSSGVAGRSAAGRGAAADRPLVRRERLVVGPGASRPPENPLRHDLRGWGTRGDGPGNG